MGPKITPAQQQCMTSANNSLQNYKKAGLVREEGGIFGLVNKLKGEKVYVFDDDKFKAMSGKPLTYGEISTEFGLPEGELKKMNNLSIGSGAPDKAPPGEWRKIKAYSPDELQFFSGDVKFKNVGKGCLQ